MFCFNIGIYSRGCLAVTLRKLIICYTFFAVLATIANLATQRYVLSLGNGEVFFAFAVGAGTIVGLLIKYILDKRWIFRHMGTGIKTHKKLFSLYIAMSIVTTAIFWGTETAFWLIWHAHEMRELGAVIGLSVGYVVKYKLDSWFVFTDTDLVHNS